MIIWLNGAFGSGKTQTANELVRRCDRLFLYDPEMIGYFLRDHLPSERMPADFQDIPMWRSFNFEMLRFMAGSYEADIVVPMTITNRQYFDEIILRLREDSIDVRHFILSCTEAALYKRLRSRCDGKDSWAAHQIVRCVNAFENDITERKIETDCLSISEVAETVAAECGLELTKGRLNSIQGFLFRQKIKLKNTKWFPF